jgi:hypothetical protein
MVPLPRVATALSDQIHLEAKVSKWIFNRSARSANCPYCLTMDLVPEIKIIVYREGESLESAMEPAEVEKAEKPKKSSHKPKEEAAAEEPAVAAE